MDALLSTYAYNQRCLLLLSLLAILLLWIAVVLRRMLSVPGSRVPPKNAVKAETLSTLTSLYRASLDSNMKQPIKAVQVLPENGWDSAKIIKRLEKMSQAEESLVDSMTISGVDFDKSEDLKEVSKIASSKFLFSNLLFYDLHASSVQLDCEVISMMSRLLQGKDKCSGLTTTGASESAMLVLLAYKRFCLKNKSITQPEVVLSQSCHPGFFKGCEFLKIKPVTVAVNPRDGSVRASDVVKKVNSNTIVVVCNAPDRCFGQMDPIEEVAQLLEDKGVFLHIDAGLGGFLMPFCQELGFGDIRTVDFSLKGITSMSIDIDGFGASAKGISCILFSNQAVQQALYWGITNWCGYLYASATFLGSKGVNGVAAGWAALMKIGERGYLDNAKYVLEATRLLSQEIAAIHGLYVVGKPSLGVLAFGRTENKASIYRLGSYLEANNWYLEPLATTHTLQLIVTSSMTAAKVKQFIALIKKGVEHIDGEQKTSEKLKPRWQFAEAMSARVSSDTTSAGEYYRQLHHESFKIQY